jgi:hypothetical protein
MNWPTWDSLGQSAVNSLPKWEQLSDNANFQIDVAVEITNVQASWWAVGKSDAEIMAKVRENLQKKG